MIFADFQMAYASFKSAKLRSFLTISGIAVGVASIALVYALGEGIQRSSLKQLSSFGDNIVTVTPGEIIQKDDNGRVNGVDIASLIGSSTLTAKDLAELKNNGDIERATPIAIVGGVIKTETAPDTRGTIVIATDSEFTKITKQKVKFGNFLAPEDNARNLAVLGAKTAEKLFQEESPIGRQFSFRGADFVVKGVMDYFDQPTTNLIVNYNEAIFIPVETAKKISDGVLEIREILVESKSSKDVETAIASVESSLLKIRGGQKDFGVYRQSEYAGVASELFSYVIFFVTIVAGISLFVAGIGIMNIMFVGVSERTKEIGVRKALGATSRQILGQFLIEALVLSMIGGIVGIFLAITAGYFITLRTIYTPYFDPLLMILFTIVATLIGTVFGVFPAIRASRQDPAKSLRHH